MTDRACASCGSANEDDARFCESCGTALQRTCAACGVEASATARFCRSCGASLNDQGAQPVSGPARKTVTVLFADLAGSTAFEQLVDPETAREVIGQYHELLRSTAERHRAGVTKYIGDGFMAVWGVPEVGAGDAGHAVDAAVELQERFVGLAGRLAEAHGVELALRVAVNTGEVVVGADDADLVGDALNVAARLESECPHGHVVVGEETWRSTRSQHRYDPRGAVQVKGRTAAVPVYQWLGRVDAAVSVPFVGRSAELRRLHTVFDDAVASRATRLVTVIGDPGVGKTRLAGEFIGSLGDGARIIRAHCAVEGSPAMAPLVEVLRTRDLNADIPADAIDRERLVRDLSGMAAGVAGSVEEAFWALRRFLEVLAAEGPLVVLIDDIQWADTLLLDFVEHLVEWMHDVPVVLVALARPELRESRPDLVTVGGWVAEALRLRGLAADATAELAARVLGSDRLPGELLARLPSSTGGNPLFVRELVGMLVHDGVLVAEPGGWRLTVDVDSIAVPPTIQALLASRLERLSAANRRVLEVASVIGTDFSPSAVAALAGVGGTDIMSALNRLRRLDLAQPAGTYAGDEPVWRFHHVLIRDVAYRRLLKSERAELHERLANWVHAGGAGMVFESDEVIARNLEAAYGYRCDLGVRDGHTTELALRSARNYLASARRALDRDELGSAGSQAARGASLAAADPALHADLLLIGCEALLSAGDVAAGAPLVDQLESVAGQELAPWASCYRCQLVAYTDPTRLLEVDGRLQDVIDEFGRRKDTAGLAKAHRVRASARARLGRIGDCETDLFEALIAARQGGDHRQITAALGAAPNAALWGPSPAPKAGGRCLDVVRMQRMTTAAPSLEATSLRCLAVLELLRGRPDKARSMLADARQVVADLGLRHGLMETELFAGIIELMAGDAVAAEPHFRMALEGLGALGVGADAGQAAALLARSVLLQGRLEEADRYAGESERIAGHNLKTAIAWRSVRGEILSAQGRHEQAVIMSRDAVALAAATDLTLDHAEACLALSRVLAAAGDETASSAARRDAEALYAAKDAVFMIEQPTATTALGTRAAVPAPAVSRLAVSNRAARISDRGFQALAARDPDAVAAVYADRMVYDDRRRISGDPIESIAELRGAAERLIAQYTHVEWQPEAVRGESLVLIAARWRDDSGNETTSFDVLEVSAEGQVIYHSRFDEDDFAGAYRELERRYYAGEGAAFAASGQRVSAWVDAICRGDVEAARPLSHNDFRWLALEKALKPENRSIDEYFHWLAERTKQVSDQQIWLSAIQWLSADSHVTRSEIRGVGPQGQEFSWSRIHVGMVRDGLLTSVREFDSTDEAAAFAYAESLAGAPQSRLAVSNHASEVGDRLISAMRAHDTAGALALWSDRFVYDDQRRISGSRIDDIATLRDSIERIRQQYKNFEARTLAVRGNTVYLAWTCWSDDAGNETRYVGVNEIDAAGLVCYHSRFDEEDFWPAYRDMESRYYGGEGARFATNGVPAADWVIGINQNDIEAVRGVSDPEFRWLAPDHSLKQKERSVDDMFRWMRERGSQVSAQRHWVSALQWLSPDCSIGRGQIEATGPDGEDFLWNFLFVTECQDGLLKRVREFDVADEDGAFDYAEQLVASRSTRLPLTNRACEVGEHAIAVANSGDIDTLVTLYSSEVVYDDRRRISGDPIVGSAAVRAASERARGHFSRFELRTLAVRGDNLTLGEVIRSDATGNQSTNLTVGEVDDQGQVTYQGTFDDDDFEAAYRELERRYYAGPGLPHAEVGGPFAELILAENRGDLDRAFEMFATPGLQIESRSQSVFPGRSAEELRRSVEELGAMVESYRVWVPAIMWVSGDVTVTRHEREAVWHDGATFTWSRLYVAQAKGGLLTTLCEFDVGDEDAAFAYAEELTRASASRLAVHNHASASFSSLAHAMNANDVDAAVAQLADDCHLADHRRMSRGPVHGRDSARAALGRILKQFNHFEHHVLAVRGDNHALCASRWSDETGNVSAHLHVLDVDDDARIVDEMRFDEDDFEGAYVELDRRYYADGGAPFAESGTRVTAFFTLVNQGDLDGAFGEFVAPGLQVENRSRSLFPDRTSAELRSELDDLSSRVSSTRMWASALKWLSPNVYVARLERVALGAGGERYEWTHLYVSELRQGRLSSAREFDLDDEDAVFAHAEELARKSAGRLAVINRAVATAERLKDAVQAHDTEKAVACYSEEFVRDDRRHFSGVPMRGIAELRIATERVIAQFSNFEAHAVAVRGDNLVLTWSKWSDDAGNESSYLHVLDIGDDGRIIHDGRFDEDDFDAAYAQLEARYYAGEGAAAARSGLTNAAVVSAMNSNDLDMMFRDLVCTDFRIENRSRSGFPNRSAGDLRASLEALGAMVATIRAWFSALRWVSPDVFVGRLDREGTGSDGERFEWTRILVGVYRDGRLARLCDFDADDEDAAFDYAQDLI